MIAIVLFLATFVVGTAAAAAHAHSKPTGVWVTILGVFLLVLLAVAL